MELTVKTELPSVVDNGSPTPSPKTTEEKVKGLTPEAMALNDRVANVKLLG